MPDAQMVYSELRGGLMPAKLRAEFVYEALKKRQITHLSPYKYATEKNGAEMRRLRTHMAVDL